MEYWPTGEGAVEEQVANGWIDDELFHYVSAQMLRALDQRGDGLILSCTILVAATE